MCYSLPRGEPSWTHKGKMSDNQSGSEGKSHLWKKPPTGRLHEQPQKPLQIHSQRQKDSKAAETLCREAVLCGRWRKKGMGVHATHPETPTEHCNDLQVPTGLMDVLIELDNVTSFKCVEATYIIQASGFLRP